MESIKHYDGIFVFNSIVAYGGPDMLEEFTNSYPDFEEGKSLKMFFSDWSYINEFYLRDWSLWWEKLSQLFNLEPGDVFYLDF